ncbi:hypothetical protein EON67_08905 [archaeon]|nr:MAG: hypothetical protein EON67_08905 [archaeon]
MSVALYPPPAAVPSCRPSRCAAARTLPPRYLLHVRTMLSLSLKGCARLELSKPIYAYISERYSKVRDTVHVYSMAAGARRWRHAPAARTARVCACGPSVFPRAG